MTEKKSKDYYSLLVTEKTQPLNIIHKWKRDFNLSDDHLREFFLLPHSVALESYAKAFQYKVLNNILYTNKNYSKLVTEQTMFALFVRPSQKLCTLISFTNALTQGDFGTILNLIGAFYQINRFVFHCRMLYLV